MNPVETFTINLEEEVSAGVPSPGAGSIEEPGAVDVYTLNVAPGTGIFVQELSGGCGIAWDCVDAGANQIFSDSGMCGGSPGIFTLALGGDYTFTVRGEGSSTGTYGFIIWELNPPQNFSINLEETVSDGVPGVGAGNIEEPGTTDVYTFTVAPGTDVYFDELAGGCGIAWNCVDSGGNVVFTDSGMCGADPQIYTLTAGGTYTATVFGEGAATGTYSFIVWEVNPPDVFAIEYGDFVSDGSPGPGAGNIEEAGTVDIFTFEGVAGEEVCFLELSGPCSIRWFVDDPLGNQLFQDNGFCGGDPGTFILPETGTYTITVDGEMSATGTYGFVVTLASPADLNDDCLVNVLDLLDVLAAWDTPDGDVTGDGLTNVLDVLAVLAAWT